MCDCTCMTCLGCDADFEDGPYPAGGIAWDLAADWAALIWRDGALASLPEQIPPAFRAPSVANPQQLGDFSRSWHHKL